MSLDSARRFLRRLKDDHEFRREFCMKPSRRERDAFVAKSGYQFTPADLLTLVDSDDHNLSLA